MNIAQPINICVLGGGFGGLYTALYFSHFSWVKNRKCQVTLIEPNDHFLFTPLLYELLTGELQRWEIAPSYQKLLQGTHIQLRQQTVKTVDLKARSVDLENGEILTYDYLVLAVGTQNRWANIPGLETHALSFRTLADLERLQTQLHILENSERQYLRLAVIGGGPNGVELSCKLADRLGNRGQVHLIERGESLLKNFSSAIAKASYKALKTRRIVIHHNSEVEAITADSVGITQNQQTQNLPFDLVIWTAGTQSREWLRHLECQQTELGRLLIRPTLQLLDYPEVFALGDIAQIAHSRQNIPATAQAAFQQASCAAKNLKAILLGQPLKPFFYLHLGDMLTLGRRSAIISSFGINIDGRIADISRRFIYILRLPTQRHKIQVLKHWGKNTLIKLGRWLRWQRQQLFSQKPAKP
ncbi:NAD(P)/FAD-dependent oxidoreductase [Aphanothece hegewaldii CCALA 016]|uniref:NAD(P)/FAD-dependent oxidoreductase n=1 Tax=Aphanothece hegewaldii CCALA 016 TaxID=2107694 RepID=A0A2T1M2S3_9CHRO|nr:NAD(P)/FAD-dependent oxidoreductase [Aphanothece hegewaldii]PSF39050.1 NAD(P)/FAD-dependent oxidoreductase [Aphanothece hegewaldii CCALA 016]